MVRSRSTVHAHQDKHEGVRFRFTISTPKPQTSLSKQTIPMTARTTFSTTMMLPQHQVNYLHTPNNENSPSNCNRQPLSPPLELHNEALDDNLLFMPLHNDDHAPSSPSSWSPPPVLLLPRLDHSERPDIMNDDSSSSVQSALTIDSDRPTFRLQPRFRLPPLRDLTAQHRDTTMTIH